FGSGGIEGCVSGSISILRIRNFLFFIICSRSNLHVDSSAKAMIEFAVDFTGNCGGEMSATITTFCNHNYSKSRTSERCIRSEQTHPAVLADTGSGLSSDGLC